ncbi:MAG: hypothetical protein V5B36_00910 [Candidatus Accumulibacter sp. UW25]|jgi:hypothetical protein
MGKNYEAEVYWAPTKKLGGGWIAYKSSSKAPETPDYLGAAEATGKSNLEAVKLQTEANRANQITPWGNLMWAQENSATNPVFDQKGYDQAVAAYRNQSNAQSGAFDMNGNFVLSNTNTSAAPNRDDFWSKGTEGSGKWTQTITLTPAEQQALEAQQQIQMNQSKLAQGLQGQVDTTMKDGFNGPDLNSYMGKVDEVPKFNEAWRKQGIDAAYNYSTALTSPLEQQREKATDVALRLQGLVPGTEAYNNAMSNIFSTNNRARQDAANAAIMYGDQMANQDFSSALAGQNQQFNQAQSGYQTAYTTALQKYLQPLNSMNAVLSGNQVNMPAFPSYAQQANAGGTDYMGATTALGNWNQGVYNRDAAAANAANGSLLGMVGSIGSGMMTGGVGTVLGKLLL